MRTTKLWIALWLIVVFYASAGAEELNTPLYDGCSGGMSATWRGIFGKAPPWEDCCDTHDIAYAKGGTREQRGVADLKLMRCVRRHGYPLVAEKMYIAVRVGGVPWAPTPYRWGFETDSWTYTNQ